MGLQSGRRARLLMLAAALLATAAALWAPPLALLTLFVAVAIAIWDRAALERDLRRLAAAVVAETPELKLEVGDGAWGELCHNLNRLRQQRRAQQQLAALLPALPLARAARLADAGLPPEGLACEVVVLALAQPSAPGDPIAQLRAVAGAALHQAQLHDALLARAGDRVLLIFGALAPTSPAASLHAAEQAARALAQSWAAESASSRPRLALAAGSARTLNLPGLGLTVLGPPVDQALSLQSLATNQLLCNEEAYLGLRRLGRVPPQPPAPQLAAPNARPAYAVTL